MIVIVSVAAADSRGLERGACAAPPSGLAGRRQIDSFPLLGRAERRVWPPQPARRA